MSAIGHLLLFLLKVYFWIIIIQVAVSWLLAFEVIRPGSPQARNLMRLLEKATDPVYKPLRKFIPPIGGIDITPMVVILIIFALENLIVRMLIL